MRSWLSVLHERLKEEAALVRVVVATVRGSAPREPGACMLVGAQRTDGTIGGGHLELKATEIARGMLKQPAAPARLDRFALGATLGQCCGGAVNLWFERYEASDLDFVVDALDAQRSGEPAVIAALPQAGGSITRTVLTARTPFPATDEARRAIAAAVTALLRAPASAPRAALARAGARDALIERIDRQGLPLWLFGAGHVGKALVKVLAGLPFQVTWIDSREHEFPSAVPAQVKVSHTGDPAALVAAAPPATYFLVLTHSHDLDYEICRAILRRGDFAWAGLIGSETKAACFGLRFGREGIDADSVARLVSPIGIDGIDCKLPEAISISVAAQLLQAVQAAQQRSATPLLTPLPTPLIGAQAS
jgi:xanthine dehydrogenase accessory factor